MEENKNPYQDLINASSAKYNVDTGFLTTLLGVESGFNKNAVSPTGPRGLGQFTKATGNAMGLKTDADFFDPAKSIDAAAHLISDLLQKNNGDYVRTALAYNQGMGTAGTPQLQAYDKNDWSMISPEGQKYMKHFEPWDDGSNAGRTQFLLSKGNVNQTPNQNISTEANAQSFQTPSTDLGTSNQTSNQSTNQDTSQSTDTLEPTFQIPQNNVQQPTQSTQQPVQPQLASFDITAGNANNVTVPSLGNNYEVDMFNETGKTAQEYEDQENSFGNVVGAYVDNSTVGDFLHQANQNLRWLSMNPAMPTNMPATSTPTSDFVPSTDDIDYLQQSGLKPQNYPMVDGAISQDDFRFRVDNALRQQKDQDVIDNNNSTVNTVVGNVAQIALDPTSYIPVGGQMIKGMKLLNPVLTKAVKWGGVGAVTAGSSMGLHDAISGQGHDLDDYLKTVGFGAALGAGFSLTGSAVSKVLGKNELGTIADVQKTADTLSENLAARSQRIEASESAETIGGIHMERNIPDMDKPPVQDGIYEHPFEKGAYVTEDGINIVADNILNPQTAEEALTIKNGGIPSSDTATPAKALAFNAGGFTEIGNAVHLSNNEEVRKLGSILVRPTSVLKDGSRGAFGLTASDTIGHIDGIDNLWSSKYVTNKRAALKNASYQLQPDEQAEAVLNRKVVEAIEDSTGSKMAQLTPEEQNFAKHIQQNFILKEDYAVNPKQLGSENAIPLLDKSFQSGNYVPRHYSPEKINYLRDKLSSIGFDKFDDMKDVLKQSFKKSYLMNKNGEADELERRIVDENFGGKRLTKPEQSSYKKTEDFNKANEEYLNQNNEIKRLVDDHIEKLSYGILKGDDNLSAVNMNMWGNDGATITEGNFLKTRSPLSTDGQITLPDGTPFSVNDIRDFDLDPIIAGYNNSIKHKIALASVGLDEKEFRTYVNDLSARLLKEGNKRDSEVLLNLYKIITGQARRDPETVLGSLASALTSSTFFLRNTYMAAMNFTEIGGAIFDGSLRSAVDNVPLLRDAFAYNTKSGRETMKSISDMNFGKYIDESFRPSYQDRVDALVNNPNASQNLTAIKAVSGIRQAVDTANHYNPFSTALRGTTNGIINAARQTIIGDMVRTAFENKALPKYLRNEQKLNGLSISKDDMDNIVQYFHDHIQYNGKGDYTVKNMKAMASDPRGAIFRRLAENYADKVILRPETISSSQTKLFPRMLNILTQFKMFSVRSINGRMMAMIGDSYYNKQYFDNSMTLILSTVLSALGYVGQTYSQSYSMPKEQRDSYLRSALDPKMLAYNSLARSSTIGGPMGLATSLYGIGTGGGPSQYLRSTNIPDIQQKQDGKPFEGATMYDPSFTGLYGRIAGQIPALSVATSLASAPYYTAKAMMEPEFSTDKMLYNTAAYNNFRNIVPNNPVTQLMLGEIFRQKGIDTEYFRKQAQK